MPSSTRAPTSSAPARCSTKRCPERTRFKPLRATTRCSASAAARSRRSKSVVPDLAEEICRIVRRAMATQPEERYQSAGELYEDLIQYLYATGRRVGARDLARSPGRAARRATTTPGVAAIGLEARIRGDDVRRSAARARRASSASRSAGDDPSSNLRRRVNGALRERTEWRDVTALALRIDDERRDSRRDRRAPRASASAAAWSATHCRAKPRERAR